MHRLKVSDLVETLKDYNLVIEDHASDDDLSFTAQSFTTRPDDVSEGSLVCLYKGVSFDPHSQLKSISEKKPAFLVVEDDANLSALGIPYLVVKNGRAAWSVIASLLYDSPQQKLKFIGVTGTNGKTSTVWFINQLLRAAGKSCTSIGTLGTYLNDQFEPTRHTTPDPTELFEILSKSVDRGIEYIVMEVSSHAIHQEKLRPIKYNAVAFTSFSQDHLDLHGTMESYFACKKRLFTELSTPDTFKIAHSQMEGQLPGETKYYGPKHGLKVQAQALDRTTFVLAAENYTTNIIGTYFCENLAAAILIYKNLLGTSPSPKLIAKLLPVPGRLEAVGSGSPYVFVDYAHTPDAIEKTAAELKSLADLPLTVVFGCGGDRDRNKRPKMYAAALMSAEKVVVTSDNPRTEDPEAIIKDILKDASDEELAKTAVQPDRRKAIHEAISDSQGVVLIAGKGHEDYQEIDGKKFPFDDRKVAAEAFQGR